MRYNIVARQTNTNTADGYNDNRFVQTSDHSYRLDDREYDVKAEAET